MREQVEGLPEGVVKAHMGKALAQLEAELGLAPAAPAPATAAATAPASSSSAPPQVLLGERSETAAVLAGRVAQAGGVAVQGPKDALALAVHAILLEEGFACYAEEEQAGGPTGFAAPVRAVPPSKLVPPRWNADPANVCLTYRHEKLKGRDLKVCTRDVVSFINDDDDDCSEDKHPHSILTQPFAQPFCNS